jgi:glutathione peroxidase-family protein
MMVEKGEKQMKKYLFLIAALGLVAVFAACSSGSEEGQVEAKVEGKIETPDSLAQIEKSHAVVGDLAPNFDLYDSRGKRVTLGDYKGKYIVLEWTDFECPYVQKHYSSGNMQQLQKNYRAKGVIWLTICSSPPGAEGYLTGKVLGDMLNKMKWDGTAYLIDKDVKTAKLYEVSTTPEMYVINPQGILIYAGAIDNKPTTHVKDIPYAKNYVAQALDAAQLGNQVQTQITPPYGCPVQY